MAIVDMMIFGNLLNKKNIFKSSLLAFFALMLAFKTTYSLIEINLDKKNTVYYKIIRVNSTNQEWGYEIYVNNTLYIRQSEIPCIQGSQAFLTYTDAERIAKKVKEKISNHTLPVITKQELLESGIRIRGVYM